MSDTPTYRIDVIHDVRTSTRYRYDWHVVRLSDGKIISSGWSTDRDDASQQAQERIQEGFEADEGTVSIYTNEQGEVTDAPVPQSLRA